MSTSQGQDGGGPASDCEEYVSLMPPSAGIFSQHDRNGSFKPADPERGSSPSGNDQITDPGKGLSHQDGQVKKGAARVNFIADFRRKCQDDAVYLGNLKHSLCLSTALFALGIVEAQSGPTFLDLQIITGTDVGQASAFFTSHSCGYLLGSTASGYVSGKKINASLTLMLSMLAMGGAVIGLPYCSPFAAMVAIRGLTGVFGGFIDTTANAEHMRIWGKDGSVLMQLLHFCFALGGVVSPLVTEPFLAARTDDRTASLNKTSANRNSPLTGSGGANNDRFGLSGRNPIDSSSPTSKSLDSSYRNQSIPFLTNSSSYSDAISPTVNDSPSTNVHWAFLITGLAVILTSTPFFFLYKKSRLMKKEAERTQSDKDESTPKSYHRKIPKSSKFVLVAGLSAFFAFYCCVEDTFANFLMTFVVRRFRSVSKSEGAHITAVYWASFAASRFLMIFVSRALSPVRVLYVGGSLMVVAFTGFTLSSGPWAGEGGRSTLSSYANSSVGLGTFANISRAGLDSGSVVRDQADVGSVPALIFFTAMAGLAMSGVFPAGLSWGGAELVKVTGRVSSCVFVSASLGSMLNPLIVSRLMQDLSNLWFCYVLLLEVSALALVFCSLLTFNRCVVDKRYGKLHVAGGHSLEVSVVADDVNNSADHVAAGDAAAATGDDDNDDDEECAALTIPAERSSRPEGLRPSAVDDRC